MFVTATLFASAHHLSPVHILGQFTMGIASTMARLIGVAVLVFVGGYVPSAAGGRVLISPSSLFPNHRYIMRELAGELVKRGHEVCAAAGLKCHNPTAYRLCGGKLA